MQNIPKAGSKQARASPTYRHLSSVSFWNQQHRQLSRQFLQPTDNCCLFCCLMLGMQPMINHKYCLCRLLAAVYQQLQTVKYRLPGGKTKKKQERHHLHPNIRECRGQNILLVYLKNITTQKLKGHRSSEYLSANQIHTHVHRSPVFSFALHTGMSAPPAPRGRFYLDRDSENDLQRITERLLVTELKQIDSYAEGLHLHMSSHGS